MKKKNIKCSCDMGNMKENEEPKSFQDIDVSKILCLSGQCVICRNSSLFSNKNMQAAILILR